MPTPSGARRRWRVRVCSALLLTVVHGAPSAAQSAFAGAGVLMTWQPDSSPYVGTSNPSVPEQGIHGRAFGGSATIGVLGTSALGAALEVSVPRAFVADQVAEKYRTHNTHRDVIVSGVLLGRAASHLIGVVGGGYVREDTRQQSALRRFSSAELQYEPYAAQPESITRNTWCAVAGIDVPIALGTHVRLTPQVRAHWIARQNDDTAESPRLLGLSPWVIRPALGVTVMF